MTILQINKFYYPKGGADVVMLELSALLERRGHTVVPFAMMSSENQRTPYAHSFVSHVETEGVSFGWEGLRTAGRMLYSREARKKLAALIGTTKPDIAHVHNVYHQLSPSIFSPLRRAKIPVVMTVHDWALISPNYTLFDHGVICERGAKHPWSVIGHRCIKDSVVASAWAAFVFNVHKTARLYERGIDRYIAPATFVKEMLVSHGFPEGKIVVLPHFLDVKKITPTFVGDYVAYVGRLSPEKGLPVLLEAARALPETPFKIAGTGPEEERLRATVAHHELRNVEFVGRLDGVSRDRFYRNALCLVVPSIWYEVFGRVVLEAYAAGKPVIASRIGALPEVVREGETGLLFPPGDPRALAEAIRLLVEDVSRRRTMGEVARRVVELEYTPELHYERMLRIYKEVIASHGT
ncbi:glycosyltransferase [Candidatus Uhrbacteria bacterium]|nr:glycosyltransferase [Candidatus Uhrbacteria bacterium]